MPENSERRPPRVVVAVHVPAHRRDEAQHALDLIASGKFDMEAAMKATEGADTTIAGQMRYLQEQMDAEREAGE